MATVTRNFTFAAGDAVTPGALHNLIDTATVTAVGNADLAAGIELVTVAAAAPSSPGTGALWFDTSPAGSQGILRVYDSAQWVPIASGFLGSFSLGSGSIRAGAIVMVDTTVSSLADARIPVRETTGAHVAAAGIAIVEATVASPLTPVITQGKVFSVLKATGAATAIGDGLGPSATAGEARSTSVGGYGVSGGGSVIGIWTEAAASGATSGQAYIFGRGLDTGVSLLEDSTSLISASVPAALATWSGSFGTPQWINLNSSPSGKVATLCQVLIQDGVTAAGNVHRILFGLRNEGSTAAIDSAPTVGGLFHTGTTGAQGFRASLLVPGVPGTNNRLEYYVDASVAAANLQISVRERAVYLGGSVA